MFCYLTLCRHIKRRTGLLNSAQFLGNLFAIIFTPFVSDIFGRRPALFFGSCIMCVGVALQAASWSVAVFIGARFCSE